MSRTIHTFKTIPRTAWRRLRYTPSYIFLIWRWGTWVYACIWIIARQQALASHQPSQLTLANILLIITFVQSLVVTLYTPVLRIILPNLSSTSNNRLSRASLATLNGKRVRGKISVQAPASDEEFNIFTPLTRTQNQLWNISIYGTDLLLCGIITYLSGPFGGPPFGASSPFYRYGLSTVLVAAFAYRYKGGLLVALGYELIVLLGAYLPPPGTTPFIPQAQDLAGALIDAPLIALVAAYLATLLESYTRSKRREQDNVRRQRAIQRVSETLVTEASNRQRLLRQSARQIRTGGHFERLIIAVISHEATEESGKLPRLTIDTYIDDTLIDAEPGDQRASLVEQVARSGERLLSFEPLTRVAGEDGLARLYIPFFKDGQTYLVLGAESPRQFPFEQKQVEFLNVVGPQLVVALENRRLTEQSTALAAEAERGRIAREIHDGVAQLTYMLSLNSETCAALAHRLAEAPANAPPADLRPLTERLDKLVTISKQALWETRNYMFTLKPLINGNTTLTQMLTNQLREFEAISGLPARLNVEGVETPQARDQQAARAREQVGTAIFRITQEALSNAYKHSEASAIVVSLRYLSTGVEVEVCDNGCGFDPVQTEITAAQRVYSGHGLAGMRTRAQELGGRCTIQRSPTGGSCVHLYIPLQ